MYFAPRLYIILVVVLLGTCYTLLYRSKYELLLSFQQVFKKIYPSIQSTQISARPKNRTSTRGVQRVFKKTSSKPKQPSTEVSHTNGREPQEEHVVNATTHKPEMTPFCENPEDLRRRAEQRRMDRDAHRNKG